MSKKEENVQKNKKRFETNESVSHRRLDASLPVEVNIDELAVMSDDELTDRMYKLYDGLNAAQRSFGDSRAWEVEIAYVRREQQQRQERQERHQAYVSLVESENAALEATLPAGDFDNSAYVYAVTGGRPRWT